MLHGDLSPPGNTGTHRVGYSISWLSMSILYEKKDVSLNIGDSLGTSNMYRPKRARNWAGQIGGGFGAWPLTASEPERRHTARDRATIERRKATRMVDERWLLLLLAETMRGWSVAR